MRCEEFETRLNDVLDQRARPDSDPELIKHAKQCTDCQARLTAWEMLVEGLDTFGIPEVPEDLADRAVASALTSRGSTMQRFQRWLPLAMAAALLVAVGVRLFFKSQPTDQPIVAESPVEHSPSLDPPSHQIPSVAAASLVDEEYLEMFRLTGEWMAVLPETVRRASEMPEVSSVANSIRPATHSAAVAIDAIWRTIPGAQIGRES